RIRKVRRIEKSANCVWSDELDDFFQAPVLRELLPQESSDGIHNFFPSAISCSDRQMHATVGFGGGFRCAHHGESRCRQQLETANRPPADLSGMELPVTCQTVELLLECSEDAGDLLRRAFTVLGGEYPQRDRRNLELDAPVKQIVKLIRACHVDIVR